MLSILGRVLPLLRPGCPFKEVWRTKLLISSSDTDMSLFLITLLHRHSVPNLLLVLLPRSGAAHIPLNEMWHHTDAPSSLRTVKPFILLSPARSSPHRHLWSRQKSYSRWGCTLWHSPSADSKHPRILPCLLLPTGLSLVSAHQRRYRS